MKAAGIKQKKIDLKAKELIKLHKGTVFDLIGGKFLQIKPKLIKANFRLNPASRQVYGLMHGGIYAYVAESLASLGAWLSLDSDSSICVGLDVNATHMRPFQQMGGIVTATARALKQGKSIQVWHIEFLNPKNELLSVAKCSVFIKDIGVKNASK